MADYVSSVHNGSAGAVREMEYGRKQLEGDFSRAAGYITGAVRDRKLGVREMDGFIAHLSETVQETPEYWDARVAEASRSLSMSALAMEEKIRTFRSATPERLRLFAQREVQSGNLTLDGDEESFSAGLVGALKESPPAP